MALMWPSTAFLSYDSVFHISRRCAKIFLGDMLKSSTVPLLSSFPPISISIHFSSSSSSPWWSAGPWWVRPPSSPTLSSRQTATAATLPYRSHCHFRLDWHYHCNHHCHLLIPRTIWPKWALPRPLQQISPRTPKSFRFSLPFLFL